jgi:hypothetical protein
MTNTQIEPNEIKRDLASTLGLNPWIGYNSSPRAQMFASHLGQRLVINGATRKRTLTGMEFEFGKYTLNVKAEEDIVVLKTIQRYRETIDKDSIKVNPQTAVIYEEKGTNRIGIMQLQKFCSYHQYFGFQYKEKSPLMSMYRGSEIPKGTVLLDSPAIDDDGNYMYGAELNIAFMSHPSVSEDGIMISRDVLDRFKFKTYETRVVEWGSKRFALNLYGNVDNYKPFPNIGEYVRDDGLLMVTRTYEKNLAPVEMSVYDVMVPDFISDRCVYANGAGGKIVDIKVYTNDTTMFDTYSNMDNQVQKYLKATRSFHISIIEEWRRLRKERGNNLVITPAFQRQVVESLAFVGEEKETPKISKIYRKTPIDYYRVEFTIEYEITPRDGFKFTDCHGG